MKASVLYGPKKLEYQEIHLGDLQDDMVRVAVQYVGLCGSDLHYWEFGRGTWSVITEPLVMGHEVSGVVAEVGSAVRAGHPTIEVGTPVAVSPAQVCGECFHCQRGQPELCARVLYLGSAGTTPHVQGGMSEFLDVHPGQLYTLPERVDLQVGALAEPLAVALHGVELAGSLFCRSILVVGAGPIGLLTAVGAAEAGASSVHISDIRQESLDLAKRVGAFETYDVSSSVGATALEEHQGGFDVVLEASGTVAGANTSLELVRDGGTVVQVGMLPAGASALRTDLIIQKQLAYLGSLRFGHEFASAVELLSRRPELSHIISNIYPLAATNQAFTDLLDPAHRGKTLVKIGNHLK